VTLLAVGDKDSGALLRAAKSGSQENQGADAVDIPHRLRVLWKL
jgi:hypothetical protein